MSAHDLYIPKNSQLEVFWKLAFQEIHIDMKLLEFTGRKVYVISFLTTGCAEDTTDSAEDTFYGFFSSFRIAFWGTPVNDCYLIS